MVEDEAGGECKRGKDQRENPTEVLKHYPVYTSGYYPGCQKQMILYRIVSEYQI